MAAASLSPCRLCRTGWLYTIFGQVIEGLDILSGSGLPPPQGEKSGSAVKIIRVTVHRKIDFVPTGKA